MNDAVCPMYLSILDTHCPSDQDVLCVSLHGEPCEAAPCEKTISILNGTKIGKEGYSPQKSGLDLVNKWVGPAASAPKKEAAAVKE